MSGSVVARQCCSEAFSCNSERYPCLEIADPAIKALQNTVFPTTTHRVHGSIDESVIASICAEKNSSTAERPFVTLPMIQPTG